MEVFSATAADVMITSVQEKDTDGKNKSTTEEEHFSLAEASQKGKTYAVAASAKFNLEKMIETQFKKMKIDEIFEDATTAFEKDLKKTQERFEHAKEWLEDESKIPVKEELTAETQAINIDSDSESDDDVQILKTTFDPSKVSHGFNAPGGRCVRARFQDGRVRTFLVPPGINPSEYLRNTALLKQLQETVPSTVTQGLQQLPSNLQQLPSNLQQLPSNLQQLPSNTQQKVATSNQHKLAPARNLSYLLSQSVKVFASKKNDIWYKGTIIDIHGEDELQKFKVKFDGKGQKWLTAKLLAMVDIPQEVLAVGTRIIARYHDEKGGKLLFSGTIAEPPSERNRLRYLVFFDDGYAQYSVNKDLHLIYEQTSPVWNDVMNRDSRDFLQNYLRHYPERPMVRLFIGQGLQVEWEGRWWQAHAADIDNSLVKMKFEVDGRIEWIYRGSARLEPLYTAIQNQPTGKLATRRVARRLHPNKKQQVEYQLGGGTIEEEDEENDSARQSSKGNGNKKFTARKSSNKPNGKDMASILQDRMSKTGDLVESGITKEAQTSLLLKQLPKKTYVTHSCGKHCISQCEQELSRHAGANPLVIPLLIGWERQISSKAMLVPRQLVVYVTPCGKRLRSLTETDQFLYVCDSKLTIDFFSFDAKLRTNVEYVSTRVFCDIKDISYGKEPVPISCVNELDDTYPDFVEYSNKVILGKDVFINNDTEFLVGCDCTDGCRTPSKCACMQMTISASKAGTLDFEGDVVGYNGRRLREQIVTGIYECNSRCKCNSTCHNRVVQNGLSLRLQVFKTPTRGWGLRCLDDIPKGGFICVYTGQLLNEQNADEEAKEFGDEYLAELDYIEVVERNKEGYESDVPSSDDGAASVCTKSSDDVWDTDGKGGKSSKQGKGKKGKTKNGKKGKVENVNNPIVISDEEEMEAETGGDSGQECKRSERLQKKQSKPKFVSTRTLFDNEEFCYIMDAKTAGNLGRYLNHSCSPNAFVQSVFVDTHDLRFPWVAFFAGQFIPSGSELTWDYNYEVGSVPNKVLYCHCGAEECRGRLL